MGRVLGMKGGLGAPVRGGPKGCKEVQGDVSGVANPNPNPNQGCKVCKRVYGDVRGPGGVGMQRTDGGVRG